MRPQRTIKLKSRGAILLLAMLFLLLLSLLAQTSMQASILEFRMSGNELFKEEAFQTAQALLGAIADNPRNFSVDSSVGYTICNSGFVSVSCDPDSVVEVDYRPWKGTDNVEVKYQVERVGPLLLDSLPFRPSQSMASSSLAFDVAIFEIKASVDGRSVGRGRAELVQGVAQLNASLTGGRAE